MFTKQQIIAASLEMQPGEMPAAVDPIASSEEIVHSISGAAAGCQATHIFSSPVIIQQAPKLANNTIEEKSGLEEPEVRYVLVEEAAPQQKAMEGDLGEFLRSHDLQVYTNVLENDHGITDVQTFTEMEKEDINLFCQVICHRIRYRKLLAELFSSLRDFLQNRPEGRSILTHYEKHGELSNSMKNELVRLILLEGLNLKLTLDSKFHSLMTGKIVELFPGEKQVDLGHIDTPIALPPAAASSGLSF
ncbi:hypothetical protein RP20_CCG007627 [Aedes albopictus]|nr:hypothetical protein RP20_CCG007627 [Aedes albopictus]